MPNPVAYSTLSPPNLEVRGTSLSSAYEHTAKNSPVTFCKQLSTYGQRVFQAKGHQEENQSNPLVQLVQERAEIWNLIGEYFTTEERKIISQTCSYFRNRFRRYPLDQNEFLKLVSIRKQLIHLKENFPWSLRNLLYVPHKYLTYGSKRYLETALKKSQKALKKTLKMAMKRSFKESSLISLPLKILEKSYKRLAILVY